MVKNPPIEMIKADGWTEQLWATHESIVHWAANEADEAAQYQGISFNEPKFGYVDYITPELGPYNAGAAWSAGQFALYVDGRVGNPTRRTGAGWSIDIFHEVVHCARFERAVGGTVLELAATEGLAYLADELYRKKAFYTQKNSKYLELDLDPDPILFEEFTDIANFDLESETAKTWFLREPYGVLRNVDLLGMQRVHAQLERGHTIGDLINQPAEDVLGL